MKTLFIISSILSITLACSQKEAKDEVKVERVIHTSANGNEKIFIPYSWQTKWFKRDLNSSARLNTKEGC